MNGVATRKRAHSIAVIAVAAVLICSLVFVFAPTAQREAHADELLQTTFDIGKTSHVAKFNRNDIKVPSMWYEFDKEFSVTNPNLLGNVAFVYLDYWNGKAWEQLSSTTDTLGSEETTGYFTYNIRQETSATVRYRFRVEGDYRVTGGHSEEFTVSGVKQAPGLKVSVSPTTQKYKKTSAKVKIRVTKEAEGKVTIYDGKKKLKTIKVNYRGFVNSFSAKGSYYSLSKKLKKGTHKIKVVYAPTGDFKKFYKTQTSKVFKVKVK
jgi:hypothetical protein